MNQKTHVSRETLNTILNSYNKDARYLQTAQISYNIPQLSFSGNFSMQNSAYLQKGVTTGHFNELDALLCLNQLMFCGMIEALELDHLDYPPQVDKEEFMTRGFIIDTHIRSKREMTNTQNIIGEIYIDTSNIRTIRNTLFIPSTFQFNDRKMIGRRIYAWKLN